MTQKIGYITVFICFLTFAVAREAAAVSVSIDKPHINIDVEAGQAASGVITLKNTGEKPSSIQVNVEDWIYDEKGERVFKNAGTTPLSCALWLDITPRYLVVPAGEKVVFNYNIKVPEDAAGGHYAVIFFESSPSIEDELKGTGVKIVSRIGCVVYQETKDKTVKTGSILSTDISGPAANEPLVLKYRFKNDGNAFIRLKGALNIIDKDGNVIGTAEAKQNPGTLPGDTRQDEIRWFGSIRKGTYQALLTVDIGEDLPPLVAEKKFAVSKDIE